MNYKLAKAVDRAKSYVSQLVVEGSSYSSNIDLIKYGNLMTVISYPLLVQES